MNDEQPSTSREFQDNHERPQLKKNKPKFIDLLSSDSESEISKILVEESKVDKVIILIQYTICYFGHLNYLIKVVHIPYLRIRNINDLNI